MLTTKVAPSCLTGRGRDTCDTIGCKRSASRHFDRRQDGGRNGVLLSRRVWSKKRRLYLHCSWTSALIRCVLRAGPPRFAVPHRCKRACSPATFAGAGASDLDPVLRLGAGADNADINRHAVFTQFETAFPAKLATTSRQTGGSTLCLKVFASLPHGFGKAACFARADQFSNFDACAIGHIKNPFLVKISLRLKSAELKNARNEGARTVLQLQASIRMRTECAAREA